MNLFADAFAWIFSPDRLTSSLPLPLAIWQHLAFTFGSVAIAALIAIPLGWLIGHTGRGREIAVALSGAARALPSLGLVLLLVLVIGVIYKTEAAVVSFVLLAIPSILAGAYAGFEAIERSVIDSGRAVGMTPWQVLWKIEVPLGLPLLIGGIRSAALQVVATATLAATVGLGGLGRFLIDGLSVRDYGQMAGGAILIAVLALLVDLVFATLQRVVVSPGLTGKTAGRKQAQASIQRTQLRASGS